MLNQNIGFESIIVREDQKNLAYTIYIDDILLNGHSMQFQLLFKLTRATASASFDLIMYGQVFGNSLIYIDLTHQGSKCVYRELENTGAQHICTKENDVAIEYEKSESLDEEYNIIRITKDGLYSTISYNTVTHDISAQFIDSRKYEALLAYEKTIGNDPAPTSHCRFFLSALTPDNQDADPDQIYNNTTGATLSGNSSYYTFIDFDNNDRTNDSAYFWYKETTQSTAGTAFSDDTWNIDCPEGFTSTYTTKIHEAKAMLTDKLAHFAENTTGFLSSIPNATSFATELSNLHASVTAE